MSKKLKNPEKTAKNIKKQSKQFQTGKKTSKML